ncbi:hypothetical protein MC885_017041 [Smutsia gigantea]|nr:hypothetical protein MC885_017041 [Smutsia gigantea]
MDYAWGANGLDAIITQGAPAVQTSLSPDARRQSVAALGLAAVNRLSVLSLAGLALRLQLLLNQFENTGPPPADKEKIQALPTVPVTEEHVGNSPGLCGQPGAQLPPWVQGGQLGRPPGAALVGAAEKTLPKSPGHWQWSGASRAACPTGSGLECPVCKDDYALGEHVRQLPCNHLFHDGCIVPWLEQHDSCPVCRKSLTGQNTATNPPGLSGVTFSSSSSSSSSSSPSNENPASSS